MYEMVFVMLHEYSVVQEEIMKRGVSLNKIDTKEQLGDIFIKGLPRPQFQYLRKKLIGWESNFLPLGFREEVLSLLTRFGTRLVIFGDRDSKLSVSMYVGVRTFV